jgi:hypothetical protein
MVFYFSSRDSSHLPLNQPSHPEGEGFWTRRTWLQITFLGVAGVAFLIGFIAIAFSELVR